MKKAKHGRHAARAEQERAKASAAARRNDAAGGRAEANGKTKPQGREQADTARGAGGPQGAAKAREAGGPQGAAPAPSAPQPAVPGKTIVMPKRGRKKPASDAAAGAKPAAASGKPASAPAPAGAVPAQGAAVLPADPVNHAGLGKEPRSRTPLKVFGIVLGVIAAVAALVYVAGAVVFMGRFFPNTVVGKTDVSMKTPEEVQQLLEASVEDYELSVKGQGFSLELTAQEAGLVLDGQTIAQSMMANVNPWTWPYEVFQRHDETAALLATYNQSGLDAALRSAADAFNEHAEAPKDAYVAFDEKKGQFAIVPEEAGTAISADAVIALVDKALVNLQASVELTPDELAQPNVLADDPVLTQAAATANALILANVDFTLAGTAAATLDAGVIAEWVAFGDDLSVTLDEAAMAAWVDEVAAACTTYQTERAYTRPDGKKVTVSGGSYGWSVDREAFLALVRQVIDADQVGPAEIPCTQTAGAFNGAGAQDWGNRYVDVDLSEQYARFYNDAGELVWESAIVSGAYKNGTSLTPTGVYAITNKESPSVLKGENDDGSKYESHVTYWMPFVGNMVGLHDATWQSSFGGTRWKDGAGSHGCVNLPYTKAQELYALIQWGDVVVVHW